MKKLNYILGAIALFISLNASAQCKMTFAEAEALTVNDLAKFEKEMQKKGFVLQRSKSNINYKVYNCGSRNVNGNMDILNRSIDPMGHPMIQLSTTDKAYFEALKSAMVKKYKYLAEYPMQVEGVNTRQHLYEGKCHISIYSYTTADKLNWHTLQISGK